MSFKDRINQVDFHWFIIRTLPHQEKKLRDLLLEQQGETKNILEVYCPTHTTVRMVRENKMVEAPLFAGCVFALATHQALVDFLKKYYPDGTILYCRKADDGEKTRVRTIPEAQMRFFRDFNENYADRVVVLERPYTDYAFNKKTNEPNEVIKVVDGPFAGRIGFLTRFNKERRLVFNMQSLDGHTVLTVSIPNIWDFHVVRLHNADGDRQSLATKKERAVDLLLGLIQGCGYGEQSLGLLYELVEKLVMKPSLVQLGKNLLRTGHEPLAQALAALSAEEAEQILYLIRYEKDNPGYVADNWPKVVLRPFLTPTSGVRTEAGKDYATLEHPDFTEYIREQIIEEQTFLPESNEEKTERVTYYAHIGVMADGVSGGTVFANWDTFLGEYFLTADNARKKLLGTDKAPSGEKLLESFANYAPTLHKVLIGQSPVRARQGMKIGGCPMNVLAIRVDAPMPSQDGPQKLGPEWEEAATMLVSVGVRICREINSTAHLAVWRRYLRTVWLHK